MYLTSDFAGYVKPHTSYVICDLQMYTDKPYFTDRGSLITPQMSRNTWETDNKQLRGFYLKQRILLVLMFVIANSLSPESNSTFLVYTQATILRRVCFANSNTRSLRDRIIS